MKKLLGGCLALLLAAAPLLSACHSYVDLDKLLYVTSILVDLTDDGKPIFVFEALKPQRSSAKEANDEERITYTIQRETISAAINDLHTKSSSEVTFAHCKVILLTIKVMQSKLSFYDIFDRRQDFISRTLVGVLDGDRNQFVQTVPKEENFAGLFLFNLINNCQSIAAKGVRVDIKEVMNQALIGDHVNSIPIVRKSSDEDGNASYEVTGLALAKSSGLVGTLYDDAPTYFNMMLDNVVTSALSVPNPNQPDKSVSLSIDHYDRDVEMEFDGQTLKYKMRLDVQTSIEEIIGQMAPTDEMLEKLRQELSDKIDENCMQLFHDYKEKGIDVFDIQEEFDRRYPSYKDYTIITSTDLEVEANVTIHGTTTKWSP